MKISTLVVLGLGTVAFLTQGNVLKAADSSVVGTELDSEKTMALANGIHSSKLVQGIHSSKMQDGIHSSKMVRGIHSSKMLSGIHSSKD